MGTLIDSRSTYNYPAYSVAYSPDGKFILIGLQDSTARLWDAQTGALIHTFKDGINPQTSVAFSPDGKTILTVESLGIARLWDAQTGNLIRPLCPKLLNAIWQWVGIGLCLLALFSVVYRYGMSGVLHKTGKAISTHDPYNKDRSE